MFNSLLQFLHDFFLVRIYRDLLMEKKEEISNNVNTHFNDVTDDLLIEILCRLPPKTLLRFKCVSKASYSLASEAWRCLLSRQANREGLLPSVSGIFYRHGQFREVGYTYYSLSQKALDENKLDISLSFLPCYPDFTIVDCCNGLLLCLSDTIDQRLGVFYVCNPLMKKWVSLSDHPAIRNFHGIAKLFYDPNHPTHFKVLRLLELETTHEKMLLIFCSNSGKWVQSAVVGEPSLNRLYSEKTRHVLFQESLCFLSQFPPHSYVVALDINKQRLQTIKLPREEYKGSLHESEGSLYYIPLPRYMSTFQIWVLKDVSSQEWVLKYEIGMGVLGEKIFKVGCHHQDLNPSGRHLFPLGFDTGPCGEYFTFRYHCKLLSYNFGTERVELIDGLRWLTNVYRQSVLYSAGLMSPENVTGE